MCTTSSVYNRSRAPATKFATPNPHIIISKVRDRDPEYRLLSVSRMSFGPKEPSKDLSSLYVLGLPNSQAPVLRGLQKPYLRPRLPLTEGPSVVQSTQIHKHTCMSACLVCVTITLVSYFKFFEPFIVI